MFETFCLLTLAIGMMLTGCFIFHLVLKTIVAYFPEITELFGGEKNVYLFGNMLIVLLLLIASFV